MNSHITGGPQSEDSYLKMSPKSGNVFYDNSKQANVVPPPTSQPVNQITLSDAMFKKSPPTTVTRPTPKPRKPEEMPMLKTLNETLSSDSENELSPDTVKMGNLPTATPRFSDSSNYVNVPASTVIDMKEMFQPRDAFSNPTYVGVHKMTDTKS